MTEYHSVSGTSLSNYTDFSDHDAITAVTASFYYYISSIEKLVNASKNSS